MRMIVRGNGGELNTMLIQKIASVNIFCAPPFQQLVYPQIRLPTTLGPTVCLTSFSRALTLLLRFLRFLRFLGKSVFDATTLFALLEKNVAEIAGIAEIAAGLSPNRSFICAGMYPRWPICAYHLRQFVGAGPLKKLTT
jgi:hypothetical protein